MADAGTTGGARSASLADRALAMLLAERDEHSLDAWYAQAGIDPKDLESVLRDEVADAIGELSSALDLADDGRVRLFREIHAPEDWDHASETRPHRWWSRDAVLAHAHWARGEGVRWLVEGLVDPVHVDHARTVALQANPMTRDEGEVALLPGSIVEVLGATKRPTGHGHPFL